MLKPVAEGVAVHQSSFIDTNTVVVEGAAGVLLIDPGIEDGEMACLAADLPGPVIAGFSTHPDWDHLLWHPAFGDVPRHGTPACAAAVAEHLSDPGAKAEITAHLEPTGIADRVSLDFYGQITAVHAATIPWEGPEARLIEHRAHAPGHAAVLIASRRVLVCGDMLSDVLVPMLDHAATDPIGDYLAALALLEEAIGEAEAVVPGHGSVATAAEALARVERDRAYVHALREGRDPRDPRVVSPVPGWEWVADVHEGQLRRLAAGSPRTQ